VESTVRDAFQRNFKVFVIGEAAGELDPRRHELALQTMHFLFADVVSLNEVIALWRAS
jgi:nicotinamidase-related amidase